MSTVYAIANQKGGVGKTTTAVNVAACIAAAGYATLVVDVDPQGNATVGLGEPREEGNGLYDVLGGDVTAEDAIRPTAVAGLSMLPSTPDLAAANVELPRLRARRSVSGRHSRPCATASRSRCSTARRRSARSRSMRWSRPIG